jgi:hypothetical protein
LIDTKVVFSGTKNRKSQKVKLEKPVGNPAILELEAADIKHGPTAIYSGWAFL